MIEDIYKSNKCYWKKENRRDNPEGILLYENYYNGSQQLCYGISKIALCMAKSYNLIPAVLLPWQKSLISESMCQMQFQIKKQLPLIVLKNFFCLLGLFLFVNKKCLLSLKMDSDMIGPYMYDSIIRKFNKKTIISLSFKERAYLCFDLCHYYYFKSIISKYPVKVVVIGDNVYRYGYLYELCKNRQIICYSPINLNSVFVKKFSEYSDYTSNFLSQKILNELCLGNDFKTSVHNYFSKRYSGNIQQHDVLSAYANKKVSNIYDFHKKYNLESNKKTVVIMSHVFADAPHVYSDPLYDDYWEWFVNTFNCLISNKNINLLIKEHPSAYLYGQKGIINEFLNRKGLEFLQVDDNESTLSILQNVEVVVTCGGTIGIEMAYFGKNVVLASKPPYSKLGFTIDFNDRSHYEEYLKSSIQNVESLDENQKDTAMKAAYALFCRANNWSEDLELGGEIIYMGKCYDNKTFYDNISKYNKIALKDQRVYKLINDFVHSGKKQFFSNN